MAAKQENTTQLLPKFIRTLREMTDRKELYSSRSIINDMMLCVTATQGMRLEALEGQADLARQQNNKQWLKTVAKDADTLQFYGRDWINHHLYALPQTSKKPSKMPATGPSRDIRLGQDPTIQRRVEDALADEPIDYSITAEEEEKLFAVSTEGQDSPTIEEFDVDVLMSDVSGCPSPQKEALVSSIVAQSPQPSAETSCLVSSIVAEETVARKSTRSPVRFPKDEARKKTTKEKTASERKSSPKRDQARPPRRTSPRKRPLSPSRSRRDHKQRRRSPSRSPQRRRESQRRRPRSPYRQRRRSSPKRHVSRRVEYASKQNQPGSRNLMSLIVKASSLPRRGPKKDARPAQVNRQVEICPVVKCSSEVSRMQAATHLPGIFDDQLEPTEELMRRRISVLKICESRLLGSVSNLSGLVDYVNDLKQVRRGKCQVSMRQTKAIEAMCHLQGCSVPEEFTLVPANSAASLLHWRILLVIVACLSERDRQDLITRHPPSSTWKEEEKDLPEGIDSHFHLDRSRAALGKPRASVEDLCKHVSPDRQFRFKLTRGVIIFCDPETYLSSEEVQHLTQDGYKIASGLHPKYLDSSTEAAFPAFQRCLSMPEVGALGEVGLDYTVDPSMWPKQHAVLDRVLEHLQPSHVLVLNARGMMSGQPEGTYIQLLYQLKGVVPREQKIHLYCFGGNRDTMDQWQRVFPNTHFGFTGMVQHFSHDSKEALRQLQEDKLLLETDAPYFRIGGRAHSSPALIGMVADMVAKIRGQTWKQVLEYASRNASRLYQMSA